MQVGAGERLARRYGALWARLGVPAGRCPSFDNVVSAYSAPARHYHTLAHIGACLDELDGIRSLCRDPNAVETALWFHDIVYDPRRADNEERSASLAADALRAAGLGGAFIASVESLILATRHTNPPAAPDEQLIADIDLAILGRPAEEFDGYERAIRREYAHVSDGDFAAGRLRFVEGLLARPRIYATPAFGSRYEESARQNLRRSLERWGSRLTET